MKMDGKKGSRLTLTRDLIVLERGKEELLLLNSFCLQPL
jgi:hypothetical protein